MTPENAISGFRCTGIFPFNREAIQPPATGVSDRISSLAQETGLNFIPLYTCSPLRRRSSSSVGETTDSTKDDSPHACQSSVADLGNKVSNQNECILWVLLNLVSCLEN